MYVHVFIYDVNDCMFTGKVSVCVRVYNYDVNDGSSSYIMNVQLLYTV